jgi:hypothetical protein
MELFVKASRPLRGEPLTSHPHAETTRAELPGQRQREASTLKPNARGSGARGRQIKSEAATYRPALTPPSAL